MNAQPPASGDAALRNAPPDPSQPSRPPVITVRPLGAMANRMMQHMIALALADRVPGAVISRIQLPEWGLDAPEIPDPPPSRLTLDGHRLDIGRVARALNAREVAAVTLAGYLQDADNFLEPDRYRQVFRSDLETIAFGDDVLLINVRMAEILSADYPPYVLVPVAFYQQVVRETGLQPVFFGQLTAGPYLDDLRAAFPDARFIAGSGALHDFEVIRRSRNICIAVSTFSWLAAWLSNAVRIIMPLTGLFNPIQGRVYADGVNLIPKPDPRYLFYLFPINTAVRSDRVRDLHARLAGTWRLVTDAWIRDARRRHASLERRLEDHLALFDEGEYLGMYGGVREAIEAGHVSSGRDHFIAHGFREGRAPAVIGADYHHEHLDAALAVARGEFHDLIHFHAVAGRRLGYRLPREIGQDPAPPPDGDDRPLHP